MSDHPAIEVTVNPRHGFDAVKEVLVNGERWPITSITWEADAGNVGPSPHTFVTLKLRAALRITEAEAEPLDPSEAT
jgi:hypothetical protein